MKELLREIVPGFFRLSVPLSQELDAVHTYVAIEGDRLVLFDTGPGTPGVEALYEAALARLGKTLEDVDRIYVTHCHVDHCGFAGRIGDRSGAAIHLPRKEYEALREQDRRRVLLGDYGRRHGLDEGSVRNVMTTLELFAAATAPFETDCFIARGDEFTAGGRRFVVLETPGHTRGQVCFYLPDERLLLSGDHVLPHITPNLSPDVLYPDFQPLESFLDSLERVRYLNVETIWPAHGEPFSDLGGRVDEIRRHHGEREAVIRDALRRLGPATAQAVAEHVFASAALALFHRGLALNETCVHLMFLEKRGQVRSEERNGRFYWTDKG